MFGQVHDSILFDCSVKDVDRLGELVYNVFIGLPEYISNYWKIDWNVKMTGEVEVSAPGGNYKEQQLLFGKQGRVAFYSDLVW
jgi:hypothetical protein